MELVAILRVLWRRRIAVAAGALVAVMVGFGLASPPTRSGVAWSSVALDTRPSQLVARTPAGAETLSWRSSLVTHLAMSTETRDRVARDLGLPPASVVIMEPELQVPAVPAALPRKAAEAAARTTEPYVVTVAANTETATISLVAMAPTRQAAKRLNEATVGALAEQGSPPDGRAIQVFDVRPAAPVTAREVVSNRGRITGAAFGLLAFFAWCALVAATPDRRRRARYLARLGLKRQHAA